MLNDEEVEETSRRAFSLKEVLKDRREYEAKKEAEKITIDKIKNLLRKTTTTMKSMTKKEWLQVLLMPVILAPFAGAVYVFLYMFNIFGDSVPDFFGYGVGPVETFLTLGLILGISWLSFKIAIVVSEFIRGLFDRIFKFIFKEPLYDNDQRK